jgi:hypothetical protein
LLRRAFQTKQEEDHVAGSRAMALRGGPDRQTARRINRLMVKQEKAAPGFALAMARKIAAEVFS